MEKQRSGRLGSERKGGAERPASGPLVDEPGMSVVLVNGQLEYEFDTIRHSYQRMNETLDSLGVYITRSSLSPDMWERGALAERGTSATKEGR